MAVRTLFINIGQLVCVAQDSELVKKGSALSDLHIRHNAAMLVDERILWIGANEESAQYRDGVQEVVDCGGRCLIPGFVDSHTHMVFAGNRSNEYARRLSGVSYQQIASEGGGIQSTVKAVREASLDELIARGYELAMSALRHGTTTLEIKSGYALSLEGELKMLRAIAELRKRVPIRIHATFLGAHDVPTEYKQRREEYIDEICTSMIPAVAAEGLAEFCDVFCDEGYYTVDESRRIFKAAQEHGLRIKVHADELACVHAAEMAADLGAVSADHLLFISDQGIADMARSGTVATLLPGTAYTLGLPFAPARKMIENDVTVALATDCNPGSCFCENMQMILSLACSGMKMSVEQSISAATLNAAAALGVSADRGSLVVGKAADFSLLQTASYADLIYHFGVNQVAEVWIGGQRCVTNI